jgi:hypothetical protein
MAATRGTGSEDAEGTWFGIGPGGNSPFWVRIVVVQGTITLPRRNSDVHKREWLPACYRVS